MQVAGQFNYLNVVFKTILSYNSVSLAGPFQFLADVLGIAELQIDNRP